MTIKMRRLIVVVPIASILLFANFLALGDWLHRAGVIGWARSIHAEYMIYPSYCTSLPSRC